ERRLRPHFIVEVLGPRARGARDAVLASELQYLRHVECPAPRLALLDLRLARETVGDDQRLVVELAHPGQEPLLAAGHGHAVMGCLEPPRAGKPAAACGQRLDLDAHLLPQLDLGIDASRRLAAAVTPDEGLALEARRLD